MQAVGRRTQPRCFDAPLRPGPWTKISESLALKDGFEANHFLASPAYRHLPAHQCSCISACIGTQREA
jgi:hypothetical protein